MMNLRFVSKILICLVCAYMLLLLPSCSKRPKGVLSEKQMVNIMADMQLVESYAEMGYSGRDLGQYRSELGESVLASYGVTREELDSTLSWYGRNMDEYVTLYDKVDKKLSERRKNLLKDTDSGNNLNQEDIIWPYGQLGVLSTLGENDGWIVSIPNNSLEKGDRIMWSLHSHESSSLIGVLGVEYTDGSGESVTSNYYGGNSMEIQLQTDTSKTVDRVYGTLRLRDPMLSSLFLDSIRMRRIPFDSVEYNKYRHQRAYGVPAHKRKVIENKDSLKNSLLEVADDGLLKANLSGELESIESPSAPSVPVRPGMSPTLKTGAPRKARSIDDARIKEDQKRKPRRPLRSNK